MTAPRLSDAEIARANAELTGKPPEEVLRWAVAQFQPHLLMATAFGVEGCCLIHMLADIDPSVRVINLETGYQFPETHALREQLRERYGIAVEYILPELDVPAYEAKHGGPLYVLNDRQCCQERKIQPLKRAIVGHTAWISAIRADQTADRAVASVVHWDSKFGLVKVNPLLTWTRREVWNYRFKHDVPYNPLYDQGYASIGCWPCTQPVSEGDDERAGRWQGKGRKECGLHVVEHQDGSGI